MRKNEICWAVFSGQTMMPFTIRSTRKQCKQDYLGSRAGIHDIHPDDRVGVINGLWDRLHERGYSCQKVIINKWDKWNTPPNSH